MRGRTLLVFATLTGIATGCGSDDPVVVPNPTYSSSMTGAKEVPAVQSSGSGTFSATLNASNVLTYNFSFTGLTSNAAAAHIHGPASTTQTAGVLVNFNAAAEGRNITLGATSGTANGTINLATGTTITATVNADSVRKLLDLGLLYVNIHSSNFGSGEIRGHILKQ